MCGSAHPDCGCAQEDKVDAFLTEVSEMPFKSAKQEKFLFANHPDIAKRWVSEHGNAPGYKGSEAVKRRMKKAKHGSDESNS